MKNSNVPIGAAFTPIEWGKQFVRELNVVEKWTNGATICDPTAGNGAIINAIMDVAIEDNITISDAMLSKLFLIEIEASFLKEFTDNFNAKYCRKFPNKNVICADVILNNPNLKFDLLIGNPPWVSFSDLPDSYKELLKPKFIEYGLIDASQKLLLGSNRVDLSALIISLSINDNLVDNGEALFFVPLSLFTTDGAHTGFRNFSTKDGLGYELSKVWDFSDTSIFDGIATKYGVAHFKKDSKTNFPISYLKMEKGQWIDYLAAPVGSYNSPLSIFSSLTDFNKLSNSTLIKIRKDQTPRQGINTCGANGIFIFDGDKIPSSLPKKFLFPLITKDNFKNQTSANKYILLPYDINSGKPLSEIELKKHKSMFDYLQDHKNLLISRKGTMLKSFMKNDLWWACLGIGPYSFNPYKVVWESYGKNNFNPTVFSNENGQLWQANQAMQAFIPCTSLAEANSLVQKLNGSNIQTYLKSMNIEGTCNWAQPGRIKRFLELI